MKRLAVWVLVGLVAVGLLAPLLANDLPIVARVGDEWHFPAFRSYLAEHPRGPQGQPWKRWWALLPESGDDFAVMPPVPFGPHEVVAHYLGNDDTGRDVLARILHGATTALWIALGAVLLAASIGIPLGAIAGYRGGWLDACIDLLVQVFLCFPPFFFVLAVLAFLGQSLFVMIAVLGALYWVSFARIVRGEFLRLRGRDFVLTARSLGVGPLRIMCCHLLPSALGPVLVNAAFVAASAVVVEASLSFLGLGAGLGTVSWGDILMQGKEHAHTGAWHLWLFPGLVLVATVAALHTLAERVARRDAETVQRTM
jgi:peptide/nickel transport system permease protein